MIFRVHKTRESFEKAKKIMYWGSILLQTVEYFIITPKLYLYEAIYNRCLLTNATVCKRILNSFIQKCYFLFVLNRYQCFRFQGVAT